MKYLDYIFQTRCNLDVTHRPNEHIDLMAQNYEISPVIRLFSSVYRENGCLKIPENFPPQNEDRVNDDGLLAKSSEIE